MNYNWNSNIFNEEITFETVICEMCLDLNERCLCWYLPLWQYSIINRYGNSQDRVSKRCKIGNCIKDKCGGTFIYHNMFPLSCALTVAKNASNQIILVVWSIIQNADLWTTSSCPRRRRGFIDCNLKKQQPQQQQQRQVQGDIEID